MSALLDIKKQSYALQRSASQGAGLTLVSSCGCFVATFDCAKKASQVLGNRNLRDAGDGITESIPTYSIPTEDLYASVVKLSARFSVALVEVVADEKGSRFVLLWKIPAAPVKVFTMEDF